MDPHEKELSVHHKAGSSLTKNHSGGWGNPNPNLTEVAGEILAIDTIAKASHNPCEEAETKSLSPINPKVSEAPICETCKNVSMDVSDKPSSIESDESMKVFLRIRPLVVSPHKSKSCKPSNDKNVWPKLKAGRGGKLMLEKTKISCIEVCDCHSVTVLPPSSLCRMKSEVYRGFSQVFSADSSQEEVYAKTVRPIVENFIHGKSGLLAASGPSGSGKTHTVFGSAREPGLVPRALRHIFCPVGGNEDGPKRSFYLAIFEIYADHGKMEKMSDLSPDGGELQLLQSGLKGLKELLITDYMQAEALIAHSMLRRNIAMTNSNSQSSRSQCIIRIRRTIDNNNGHFENQVNESVLTFVDLAGAEREKKSGNQGDRLRESNFINKTSMVFGLCLKSLLEHQKNPKKPLRKHFQSTLLTRYLRDYMEGNKPMALILTVRPAVEDYLETSFLLRQASPYMEIKFLNKDESAKSKRHCETMINVPFEKSKRMKILRHIDLMDKVKISARASDTHEEIEEGYPKNVSPKPRKVPLTKVKGEMTCEAHYYDSAKEREYKILSGVAKSIWKLLKEYNQKIKVLEKCNEELQNEISGLKISYVCQKEESVELASLAARTNSETASLLEDLVGPRRAVSYVEDEIDVSKKIENELDMCKNGCDLLGEQRSTYLIAKGDHISASHEAKEDEIAEKVEDYQPVNTNESEKKARISETQSQHLQDDSEGGIDVSMEIEIHTAKSNKMVGEVEDCCPANMMKIEKKANMSKTEPEDPPGECCGSPNLQGKVNNDGSYQGCDLEKEDDKKSCSDKFLKANMMKTEKKANMSKTEPEDPQGECCGSPNLQGKASNDGSYQGCDLEKEDGKESCSDKFLKASYEKQKSNPDLASATTSKSNHQLTCQNEKQKKYINCNGRGNFNSASEPGMILTGEKTPVKTKPKRRLMPSSSVLLKHVSNLDFKDDGGTVVGRSERISAGDDNLRAANASLLRLLRVDAHP